MTFKNSPISTRLSLFTAVFLLATSLLCLQDAHAKRPKLPKRVPQLRIHGQSSDSSTVPLGGDLQLTIIISLKGKPKFPKTTSLSRAVDGLPYVVVATGLKDGATFVDDVGRLGLQVGTHTVRYLGCEKKSRRSQKVICLPHAEHTVTVLSSPRAPTLLTNTVLGSSANPSVHSNTVTFTAAVAPAQSSEIVPTGSVTFLVDGRPKAASDLTKGLARVTLSDLPAGSHDISAAYSGDVRYSASTSPSFTQIVTASFAPRWRPTGARDVTEYGLVGDGVTDNAASLQNLIDSIPNNSLGRPIGAVFYFPAGTYFVSRMVDISRFSWFGMFGDVDAKGDSISVIKSTAPNIRMISMSYGAALRFQIQNMRFIASNVGSTAVYVSDSSNAVFENCMFTGYVGLNFHGFSGTVRDSQFIGTSGSHIGLIDDLATGNLVENSDFTGWEEGIRSTGTGASIIRSTFSQNKIGAKLGTRADGSNWFQGRSSFRNLRLFDNDIGLDIENAGGFVLSDVEIIGTGNAPSGQSTYGIRGGVISRAVFLNLAIGGGFRSAGFSARPAFDTTSFYNSRVTNSLSANAWVWNYSTGNAAQPLVCPANSSCVYTSSPYFHRATMACASGVMLVSSSSYGAGSQTRSCMSYVASECDGKPSCTVVYRGSNCGGDPAPGMTPYGEAAISCTGDTPNPLSGFRRVTFSDSALPQPANVDDTTASHVVGGPQSSILDVTTFGVVADDSSVDNAPVLQALIDNAAPGTTFYFPRGNYFVRNALDFSRLRNFSIVGDGSSSGGAATGTSIRGTSADLIKADYGTGAGTFHLSKVNLRAGNGSAVYARNAVLSSIDDVYVNGRRGIYLENPFKVSLRSVQAAVGTQGIGVVVNGGYGTTLEAGNFLSTALNSLRVGGSTDFAVYASRFESENIAMNLGIAPDGSASPVIGISVEGITEEANNYHLIAANVVRGWFGGIGTQGSTNAPAGLSIIGAQIQNVQDSTFLGFGMSGAYSGYAVQILPAASNLLFLNCSAGNGGSGLLWDNQSSSNIVFQGCNN